ncbi:unnamed protein product, partial [Rotaria sp. Silwood2]
MAVSLKKSEVIIKQCEALSQLVAKFNKDVENMIAITTNDMNYLLSSIQENIKETTSIVMNDLNEWEEIKKNLSTTIIQGKVVLNVGGREFLTTVETLTKEKNSFFTGLFSE